MKKLSIYLNSMKFKCFVLLTCLSLAFATTSCNNDDFELNEPEQQKQYTKAELIEQALNRMPRTRANDIFTTTIVSIKDSVRIQWSATEEDIIISWDGEKEDTIPAGSHTKTYTFKNTNPSHSIFLSGTDQAIKSLNINDNEVIFLNASYNKNLTYLSCMNNDLDEIVLTNCSKLEELYISNNEFSSIDIAPFSSLKTFEAEHNRLTNLDVSKNEQLDVVYIGYNQIKNIDFSKNPYLYILSVRNNPISNLNLNTNTGLMYIDVSYTTITDFDLSKSRELIFILLENTPIKTFNNQPINKADFSFFYTLGVLNIAYTSFDSLDVSRNIHLYDLDVSGTTITRLDISNSQIERLCATRSKLTNLICGVSGFYFLHELHIERTPFENNPTNMTNLLSLLPSRSELDPGHLYTYYSGINDLASQFLGRHWLINR